MVYILMILSSKVDQMIMEHELAWQSGIEFLEYQGTIHFISEDEK